MAKLEDGMKDVQDADAEADQTTHLMRLPWPLVAVGLLALLVVIFGIGLFANRYLRPQVGLVPTSEPAVIAAPPVIPTPLVAVAVSTPVPTLVLQAPSVATATPAPATAAPTQTIGAVTPTARPT